MSTLETVVILGAGVGAGYAVWRLWPRAKEEAPPPPRGPAVIIEERKAPKPATPMSEPKQPGPAMLISQLEPQPGPAMPVAEPQAPNLNQRITRSTVDAEMTVRETPDELLAQARRYDPQITLDELTAARLVASEHGSGSFAELTAIIDSELNRAERKGHSLFQSLTYRGTFGRQGGAAKRPASTRQDPRMRHVMAARAVLSGNARGISRGATLFFNPEQMELQARAYKRWLQSGKQGKKPLVVSCDALTLLEAWCFDLGHDPATGNRCPPNRGHRGKNTLAWVGPIDGIDPWRLMLMKPMALGEEHTRAYQAARQVILTRKTRGHG